MNNNKMNRYNICYRLALLTRIGDLFFLAIFFDYDIMNLLQNGYKKTY